MAAAEESEDQPMSKLAKPFRLLAECSTTEDFIPPRSNDAPRNPFEDGPVPATQAQVVAAAERYGDIKPINISQSIENCAESSL